MFCVEQAAPQEPQLVVLVAVAISQPVAASVSQSEWPVMQAEMAQAGPFAVAASAAASAGRGEAAGPSRAEPDAAAVVVGGAATPPGPPPPPEACHRGV